MTRPIVVIAAVLGVVFLALTVCYFALPAGSLPGFLPGYEAGATGHHSKHAIAALVVALALFAFAWFQSKPRRA
jgi:hypothetical protein